MQTCLNFLKYVMEFINNCLQLQPIAGITLRTILFYNLILIVMYTSFARRR